VRLIAETTINNLIIYNLIKYKTKQNQTQKNHFHQSKIKSNMKLNLFFLSATAMVNAAIGTNTVDLGTAGNYRILAKTGITTTPGSHITGDIAVSPIAFTAMTGFGTLELDASGQFSKTGMVSGQVTAANYAVPTPSTLTTAVSDMETASKDAEFRSITSAENLNLNGGGIGGQTLTAGVYKFTSAVSINTDVTLLGNENDIFIIQTTGALTQDAGTKVILSSSTPGGDPPLANNIFWQVDTTVTVGTTAHMEGIILAKTAVTFMPGSTLNGRILGQTNVVLQAATLTGA
jgi:hypothetical protein